ncbi:hypothetical protein C7293_10325 [filamentous cyanobacterium CCT1]|nr:hypothetical protein C7293_10325 [filamentous cyanobacterium CCT1]PSN80823.1 hypothetical protein C8B47_04655 [filamentous cyanobacterium CCP4]
MFARVTLVRLLWAEAAPGHTGDSDVNAAGGGAAEACLRGELHLVWVGAGAIATPKPLLYAEGPETPVLKGL